MIYPVFFTRLFREEGCITVCEEPVPQVLSHKIIKALTISNQREVHICINEKEEIYHMKGLIESAAGIVALLKKDEGIEQNATDHFRSDKLINITEIDGWFAYYFRLDDSEACEAAHTADIRAWSWHNTAKLFIDMSVHPSVDTAGLRLLRNKLGLLNEIILMPIFDTEEKVSHGKTQNLIQESPRLATQQNNLLADGVHASPISLI